MPAPINRRALELASFDEARRELDDLLARGYDRAGNWDLAQVCGHLAEWLRYPIDGYPPTPLLARLLLWAIRHTIGPSQARKVLSTGRRPSGGPTIKASVPAPGGDAAEAVARLKATIDRWEAHDGPLHASPLFGSPARSDWDRLQLIHLGHHLAFLVPRRS